MFSVYGDTVLDPFWGTGTTTMAAMAAARHSIGYEIEPDLVDSFDDRVATVPDRATERQQRRLRDHRAFVEERRAADDEPGHVADHYGVPVVTRQETRLTLYAVEDVETDGERYVVTHTSVDEPGPTGG
jgi:2-phosphoglycerate kinase